MEQPPYDGQGDPLDEADGLSGQWVHRDHVAIFRSPPHEAFMKVTVAPGVKCFGFNAAEIAFQLGCTTDEIWHANKSGVLGVHWQQIQPAALGAVMALRYTFQFDGRTATIDLQGDSISGRA